MFKIKNLIKLLILILWLILFFYAPKVYSYNSNYNNINSNINELQLNKQFLKYQELKNNSNNLINTIKWYWKKYYNFILKLNKFEYSIKKKFNYDINKYDSFFNKIMFKINIYKNKYKNNPKITNILEYIEYILYKIKFDLLKQKINNINNELF